MRLDPEQLEVSISGARFIMPALVVVTGVVGGLEGAANGSLHTP